MYSTMCFSKSLLHINTYTYVIIAKCALIKLSLIYDVDVQLSELKDKSTICSIHSNQTDNYTYYSIYSITFHILSELANNITYISVQTAKRITVKCYL